MAEALLAYPQLADLLGERHRIIGNNWQNACTARLVARPGPPPRLRVTGRASPA
jgi:hypothetical protein